MTGSWLANADPKTAWAHKAWPAFAPLAASGECLVILPVHGFRCHAPGLPLDQEELLGSALLHRATRALADSFPVLVLPPLRHVPGTGPDSLLGIDYGLAHEIGMSIARGVHESGFGKLVLLNTNAELTPFSATLAIDARAAFGLQAYVVHADMLGLRPDLPDGGPVDPAHALVSLLAEIREHRSGRLARQPSAPTPAEEGAGSPFPSRRSHYLPALSLGELAALPGKDTLQVILPTASIEQHGHHLPVGVDSILGQAQLDAMLAQDAPRVLIAPPVTYGKSNEHTGFPGTLSIGAPALHRLVSGLVAQLHGLGFRHIRLFNTHGGNTAVLRSLVGAGGFPPGCSLSFLQGAFRPGLPAQEAAWGMHADEWETSLMLACAPELVDMSKACCEYPARLDDPGLLRPEKAPATFAWLSRDVSHSGVMGDATRATAAKGQEWLAAEGQSLRDALLSSSS